MDKSQLIEAGRHYFDNKEVNIMYATPDGNFFFEHSKSYADSHAKSRKDSNFEVIEITRADLKSKPESNNVASPSELDELKAEGKRLKIKGFAIMKAETLKRKIEEHGTA